MHMIGVPEREKAVEEIFLELEKKARMCRSKGFPESIAGLVRVSRASQA